MVQAHLITVNPLLDAQLYRCHQCGALYQHALFWRDDSLIWAACTHCDAQYRQAGEPGFDPIRFPRWNVISFSTKEHQS
jgi:DNA-directed RNA polymerase subunit RPC12/RpoP